MLWARGSYRSYERSSHDDRAWVEAELKDVGDHALMRGLVRIPDCASGAVPILLRASSNAGHKASNGCSPAVVPPPPMREVQVRCGHLWSDRLRLPRNSPHEAGQLPGNRGANHRRPLSPSGELSISRCQPTLSFHAISRTFAALPPGGIASSRRPSADGGRSRRSRPACAEPRPLPALVIAPRLNVSPVDRSPGTRPRIAHQLARAFKSAHVADLRSEGDGDDQIDPS